MITDQNNLRKLESIEEDSIKELAIHFLSYFDNDINFELEIKKKNNRCDFQIKDKNKIYKDLFKNHNTHEFALAIGKRNLTYYFRINHQYFLDKNNSTYLDITKSKTKTKHSESYIKLRSKNDIDELINFVFYRTLNYSLKEDKTLTLKNNTSKRHSHSFIENLIVQIRKIIETFFKKPKPIPKNTQDYKNKKSNTVNNTLTLEKEQVKYPKKLKSNQNISIEDIANNIPNDLKNISGSVFYSGKNAFSGDKKLYLLGINPGGSIEKQRDETIEWHTNKVLFEQPQNWSAYKDESWNKKTPGTHKLQTRILHLLCNLGLSPYDTPASNIVFVRSSREEEIKELYLKFAEQCWPFHENVISKLKINTILCFGRTPGNFVKNKLKANNLIDTFIEKNNRKWKTNVYQNSLGQKVIIAPHPSVTDWTNKNTDPSEIVLKHMDKK